jgi:dynein heavy chain
MKMLLEDQEQIPWDSMLFVSGHINYGGRVTDEWDRRCLISMLKKFYTEDVLKENYLFSESGIYTIPPISNLDSYKSHIESFPLHEDPRVFGLNENADITY